MSKVPPFQWYDLHRMNYDHLLKYSEELQIKFMKLHEINHSKYLHIHELNEKILKLHRKFGILPKGKKQRSLKKTRKCK